MLNKDILLAKKQVSSGWWNSFPEMHSDIFVESTTSNITYSQVLSYDMDGATVLSFFLPKDDTAKTASFEIDQYCSQVDFLSSIYSNHLDLVKTLILFLLHLKKRLLRLYAICNSLFSFSQYLQLI